MPLKDTWQKWKKQEEEEHSSLMIWKTGEYIGSWKRKQIIEKGGNDILSIEHDEEIQVSSISPWTC